MYKLQRNKIHITTMQKQNMYLLYSVPTITNNNND